MHNWLRGMSPICGIIPCDCRGVHRTPALPRCPVNPIVGRKTMLPYLRATGGRPYNYQEKQHKLLMPVN